MKNIRYLLAGLFACFILIACVALNKSYRAEKPFKKIAYAAHGELFDKDWKVIELDEKSIVEIHDSMIDEMSYEADEKTDEEIDSIISEISETDLLDEYQKQLAKSGVIEKYAEQDLDKLKSKFLWKIKVIRTRMKTHCLGEVIFEISDLYKAWGIYDYVKCPPPAVPLSYIAKCISYDVPIPPDWPNNRWKFMGSINPFFYPQLTTDVWAYKHITIPGHCFALHRHKNNYTQFLAFICQSEKTGKACFWDNRDGATSNKIKGVNVKLEISKIQNGYNMSENCTDCHRGNNAFLIHPYTALDVKPPYDIDPAVRYIPVGAKDWSNPGPLTLPSISTGEKSCSSCHEIPELSNQYCSAVLEPASKRTMPKDESVVGWPPSTSSRYYKHVKYLKETYCDKF